MVSSKFRFLSLLFLLFISCVNLFFSADKDGPTQIGLLENIVFSRATNTIEVKILCNFYTRHRQFVLSNPNKIVIDLFNIEDIKTSRYFEVNDFGIQAIRAGMFKIDIARVVFDLIEEIPPYKIEKIQGGLKVSFWPVKAPEPQKEEVVAEEKPQEEYKEKAEEEKEAQPQTLQESEVPSELKEEIKESQDKIDEQSEETKKILGELTEVLDEIQEKERKKFVRIEALGGYFRLKEKNLRDVYESGFIYGASLNVGILEFVELWIAEKYFSKKVIDEVSGEERRINLFPLEAGLKLRLGKGKVNPYLGFGASYYQYKEVYLTEEVKDKNIGFIGLAGCFFKIKGSLVFDIHAHYSSCQITSGEDKFNVGGLQIGAGIGFEY